MSPMLLSLGSKRNANDNKKLSCRRETVRRFVSPFRQNTGVTDGQTSCHGVVRAMHTCRAVKTSIYVTVKPTRPEGSIMMHPPNLKSNFGVVWPWRLTSWTPNVHRFMPVTRVPTFQFAAKSVHSFSKYRLHKPVTNERTERSHCPNSVLPIQIT